MNLLLAKVPHQRDQRVTTTTMTMTMNLLLAKVLHQQDQPVPRTRMKRIKATSRTKIWMNRKKNQLQISRKRMRKGAVVRLVNLGRAGAAVRLVQQQEATEKKLLMMTMMKHQAVTPATLVKRP